MAIEAGVTATAVGGSLLSIVSGKAAEAAGVAAGAGAARFTTDTMRALAAWACLEYPQLAFKSVLAIKNMLRDSEIADEFFAVGEVLARTAKEQGFKASPEVMGRVARRRLQELGALRAGPPEAGDPPDAPSVAHVGLFGSMVIAVAVLAIIGGAVAAAGGGALPLPGLPIFGGRLPRPGGIGGGFKPPPLPSAPPLPGSGGDFVAKARGGLETGISDAKMRAEALFPRRRF